MMSSKSWIERTDCIEAPMVTSVNFQVRTGVSAPFEPHMTGDEETPAVAPVNFQVRTGVSAPFEPHMTGDQAPAADAEVIEVPAPAFLTQDDD